MPSHLRYIWLPQIPRLQIIFNPNYDEICKTNRWPKRTLTVRTNFAHLITPLFPNRKGFTGWGDPGGKNRETNAREKVLPLSTTKSGENVLSHLSLTEFKRQGHSD